MQNRFTKIILMMKNTQFKHYRNNIQNLEKEIKNYLAETKYINHY